MGFGDYLWKARARQRAADRARARRAPTTAFVLSGGGVLGAVQVGQLLALAEREIAPDILVATSVGSLNASLISCEPTLDGARKLAAIWTRLRSEDIFPGGRVARAWHVVSGGDHIYPNDGIRKLVERLPIRTFEECAVPLHIGAMNLRSGEERWFSSGSLLPAVLASTALPGIFPPVAIDGDRYIDGGVVNNVPISRAIEQGATRIYVLTCAPPRHDDGRPIRRPLDVLVTAFAHSRANRVTIDLERFADEAAIVMMPTFDPGFIRYNDPSHSDRLITRSLALCREQLDREQVLEA